MKIFLSWSRPASHELALILHGWLPDVIHRLEPWMSSEDISKGQRWNLEVGALLNEISDGIICVTPDNAREPEYLEKLNAITDLDKSAMEAKR